MVKFSIIVPVYNVEKYLSECVDSIINQDFDQYEIILVDDGSTDRSGLICDEYSSAHDNISVIHKVNGGLSDARNNGLEKSKGEYIIFIDGDDYIEPGTLQKFNNQLIKYGNPDVMITRLKKVYEDAETKYSDKDMPFELINKGNKKEVVNWLFSHSNGLWTAPRYITKRSIIEENKLRFAVGYLHEDIDWTSKLLICANTFAAIDYYWYNHRMGRQGSITTEKKPKRTLDIIDLVSKNIKDLRFNNIDATLRNVIFNRMVKSVFFSLSHCKYYDSEGRKEVIRALEENKDIFIYVSEFRHKIFILVSRIFGFNVSLFLMNIFHMG